MRAVLERTQARRGARRTTHLLVLLVALALLAAACGGSEESSDTQTEAAAQEQSAASGGSDAPVSEEPASDEQAAGSCYEDQTATFVVSFDAGGGYDQIARLMAPALEEELGATVVVENQAGAGGLLALRSLLTAEPDGLRFGFFTGQGIVGSVIGEAEGSDLDILDFTFIGRVSAEPRVLAVSGSSDYPSIEDVQAAQGLKYATAGPGASDNLDANVLIPVLGLDAEIITGFDGSAETELALTSGDVELASGTLGSRLSALESGDHRPVLAIGSRSLPEFPDVPALTDLDLSEENLAIAESYDDLQQMGRMIWAPPEVPEECATQLEDAIATVLQSPDFMSQMEDADQEIEFASGQEMRETTERLLDSPEAFVTLLKEAFGSAGG